MKCQLRRIKDGPITQEIPQVLGGQSLKQAGKGEFSISHYTSIHCLVIPSRLIPLYVSDARTWSGRVPVPKC